MKVLRPDERMRNETECHRHSLGAFGIMGRKELHGKTLQFGVEAQACLPEAGATYGHLGEVGSLPALWPVPEWATYSQINGDGQYPLQETQWRLRAQGRNRSQPALLLEKHMPGRGTGRTVPCGHAPRILDRAYNAKLPDTTDMAAPDHHEFIPSVS